MDLTEVVLADGTTRKLGNKPRDGNLLKSWPVYGDVPNTPLVDKSEWKDRCDAMGTGPEWQFLLPSGDQNGIGQCNCCATVGAIQAQRAKQGLPYVQLSAADLYHRISGGQDNGSTLEDGIHEAMTVGVASTATVPYLDWQTNYPAAATERPKYRVLEAYLCPTFAHCFSAVLEGFELISGIAWYDNYTPDKDGWLPHPRGRFGGHAIYGFKPTYRNNVFGVWHQNSWGAAWGVNGGCFVIPETAYGSNQFSGWWAARTVVDDGGVIPQTN